MIATVPTFLDAFLSPIRDSTAAQVGITAVLILMVLDIVFGLANAIAKGEYESSKMREGIAHKCAELGFILVGIIADATIIGGVDIGFTAPVLVTVCVYLAVMEIGSLLETFAKMNPQLAKSPLFKLLASVVSEHEEDGEDD